MKILLSPVEARIIGCLLEKQVTTPDQYPMSLNGVVTACNQKSNREPVMTLAETGVQDALDMLAKKHLVTSFSGSGQRVVKYEHRFCNSEFGQLKFSAAELALVATLLLRGPQTPGELRTRSARLHEFADMAELERTLENLAAREDGPFVVRLAREPGKRESRYMHLFSGEVDEAALPASSDAPESGDLTERVAELERQMVEMQRQLAQLLKGS